MPKFNPQVLIPIGLGICLIAVLTNQSKFRKFGGAIADAQSAPQSKEIEVDYVKDGDTVKLKDGRDIRLCGIDAPETAKKGKGGQPLGDEAKEYLQKLVNRSGGKGYLTVTDTDRYGRTVGELVLIVKDTPGGELHANSEMVMAGMAWFYRQYSKCPNAESFDTAESIAKKNQVGVHANPGFEKPWAFRGRMKG